MGLNMRKLPSHQKRALWLRVSPLQRPHKRASARAGLCAYDGRPNRVSLNPLYPTPRSIPVMTVRFGCPEVQTAMAIEVRITQARLIIDRQYYFVREYLPGKSSPARLAAP